MYDYIASATRNELHWLPIKRLIDYKLSHFARNFSAGTAPDYLIDLCQLSRSIPGQQYLRSAERDDLLTPSFHTEYGRHSFSVAGPQLWNSLPAHVRQHFNDKQNFKKLLKTLIYSVAQISAYEGISIEALYKYSLLILRLLLLQSEHCFLKYLKSY